MAPKDWPFVKFPTLELTTILHSKKLKCFIEKITLTVIILTF